MAKRDDTCGCCEGTEPITPEPTVNRPGLPAVAYRVGTHATFLETMKARLSSHTIDADEFDGEGKPKKVRIRPLQNLRTRDEGDPAIALLDAWATVADVLTFYQERIANEGYLGTALERRSVLELARLIGYALRPGVAASVWLAMELEKGYGLKILPYELRAQSLPGPGETPQTFENIETIELRQTWNKLQPRIKQPQTIDTITQRQGLSPPHPRIYVKGISTNLQRNDVVLLTVSDEPHELYRVVDVKPDPPMDRTLVTLITVNAKTPAHRKADTFTRTAAPAAVVGGLRIEDPLKKIVIGLTKKASVPPRSAVSLERDATRIFDARADVGLQIAGTFQPKLQESLPATLANVRAAPDSPVRAFVFRAVARPFGHNAPLKSRIVETSSTTGNTSSKTTTVHYDEWMSSDMLSPTGEAPDGTVLYLDAKYEKVLQDSWMVIDTSGVAQRTGTRVVPAAPLLIGKVSNLKTGISRAAYGMSGPSTSTQVVDASRNELKAWFKTDQHEPRAAAARRDDSFQLIRQTTVFIQSEELVLADEPIETSICGGDDDLIELDGLYSGLQSGRWLIVAGERDDIKDETDTAVRGVMAAEVVMLAEVTQKAKEMSSQSTVSSYGDKGSTVLPGDQTHTFIKLAKKLEYSYRRDTVSIYGNVVKATHGETQKEILGSGNAGQAFQSFALKQPPITYSASPTPAGAASSLKVYVNDVQWHETDSLAAPGPKDRIFVTKTDDDGKAAVIFGNGRRGLRLPTGIENVRSVYRKGIGKGGNVRAEQISQLMSKPLGVKGVINPLRASGGADRESRDTARTNAPRTVTALDRLVSLPDYADFARTFAGIGKAIAAKITDGRRQWVQVTIAGADDIPIDETSDLYSNLLQALRDYGDPYQPVALQVRELMLLLINANVGIMPDYQWETVADDVRKTLLSTFSFERRELGQDVLLSEVIAAIQSVRGVAYVDVDALGGIPEKTSDSLDNKPIRRLLTLKEIAQAARVFLDQRGTKQPEGRLRVNLADVENGIMRPAQLAYLSPDVADTLVINQKE